MEDLTTAQKRAEVEARGGAATHRDWVNSTAAGDFRRREGMTERTDFDLAERIVEETRSRYRNAYGRELHADEVEAARKSAELRARVVVGGVVPTDSWSLAKVHNWGVSVKPREGLPTKVLAGGKWVEVEL